MRSEDSVFADLFEAGPVSLVAVDEQGQVRAVNARARTLLELDDAGGERSFASLFERPVPDLHALLDAPRAWFNARIRRPTGPARPVRLAAGGSVASGGQRLACIVLEDANEQSEGVARLHLVETALQNTAEAVMILDAAGYIRSVNRAYSDITGHDVANAVGRRPLLSDAQVPVDFLNHLGDLIREQGEWEGELWSERRDGTRYPAQVKASYVASPDAMSGYYVVAFRDISSHKAYEDRIDYLAYHDGLTGLANRALVRSIADTELSRTDGSAGYLAVLLINIDGFVTINESLGHAAGDELLRRVGQRLSQAVRARDTVGRQGSDEFVVIATRLRHPDNAAVVVDKIRRAFETPFAVRDQTVFVTTCIGVSRYPSDGVSLETLLRNASVALLRAKSAGHNSHEYYVPDMNVDANRVLKIRNNLHRALERDEFRLYYQPFVDLASGRVTGMEALIRWQNAELGMVAPGEFIPVAEESGLIVPIGDWVLREACRELSRLHAAGHDRLRVAVNLSARQFLSPRLANTIAATLAESGVEGRFLEVEITETMLMTHTREILDTLELLHRMGVAVALDDFGTGYSSLSYLKSFPIHYLKIDKSFVDGIPGEEHDVAITRTIIGMAQSLGVRVTAEGVETDEQRRLLSEWRCEEAQGYLFSMPLDADDLRWLLDTHNLLPIPAS